MWISKKKYEEMRNEAYESGKSKNLDLQTAQKRAEDNYKQYIDEHMKAGELERKVDELRSKIREQSEADMVLTALKLIMKSVNGEAKEKIIPLYGSMLAQQQQAASIYYGANSRNSLADLARSAFPSFMP